MTIKIHSFFYLLQVLDVLTCRASAGRAGLIPLADTVTGPTLLADVEDLSSTFCDGEIFRFRPSPSAGTAFLRGGAPFTEDLIELDVEVDRVRGRVGAVEGESIELVRSSGKDDEFESPRRVATRVSRFLVAQGFKGGPVDGVDGSSISSF